MKGQWVQIVSWHIVETPTRAFDTFKTLCSRRVTTKDVRDEFPAGEKTCETCLRIAAKEGES